MKAKLAILIVAGIVLSTQSAEAQKTAKVHRIGFLAPDDKPSGRFEAFRQGLRDLGYIDGQNIKIEFRGDEDRSKLAELAKEFVREKVDLLVTQGYATRAAQTVTTTLPIVSGYSGDPIEAGLVKTLARPGGNITGMSFLAFELVGKRLEVLQEVAPKVSRISVLASPAHPGEQRELRETQNSARSVGVTLLYHQVMNTADVNAALDATIKDKANALHAFPDPVTSAHRKQITEFAAKHRLPSLFGWGDYVEAGGLMSYGPDHNALWRRLSVYVDKILKGAKPANLPVELPTKFELVINLKTAQQIGLTIPPNVLARADRVIK